MQAICRWLNARFGGREQVAWAKQDPTRTDLSVPTAIRTAWPVYERGLKRYGNEVYALYRPSSDREGTRAALTAMLDVMFEERGYKTMAAHALDSDRTQQAWFAHLMPQVQEQQIVNLLEKRRYVILQGPPGTGKTRLAGEILRTRYQGHGRTIQFHPNTTYENFIGGLAPVTDESSESHLGLRFTPAPGALMQAAEAALRDPSRPYLLHIDEINRADLGKILGEALYLLEPDANEERRVQLPYDFGQPFHRQFFLPPNLHLLGTMNNSDRSIAILDIAVRRRFAFIPLWPDSSVLDQSACPESQQAFRKLISIFVEHAPGESLALAPGHSYFLAKTPADLQMRLKTSLAPLLEEYLAQGYVSGFAESIRTYLQGIGIC
jgi:5-methylcytosine-specific restriction protein B